MDAAQAVMIITFRSELNLLLSMNFTITKNSETYTIVDINPPYLL